MRDETPTSLWMTPLVFALSFVVIYFSAIPLLNDADIPWHLAAGRLILRTHEVPHTDPWSYVSDGSVKWYLLSWLWDVMLAAVERAGGLFSVYALAVAGGAGLVASVTHRLLLQRIAPSAVLLTGMVCVLTMLEFTTARPHLAGYGLIVAFHAILSASRGRAAYGKLLWLPPLMALWVNLHGSYLAGFSLLAAYVAEAAWTRKAEWRHRLITISAACSLALLVNPYGIEVLTGAAATLGSAVPHYIVEWKPFTFNLSVGLSAWLLVFVLASNIRVPHVPLADKLIACFWLVGALTVLRNGAIAVLVSAPYLASCIDWQTRDIRQNNPQSPPTRWLSRRSLSQLWSAAFLAVAGFTFVAASLPHEGRLLTAPYSAYDAIDEAVSKYSERHFLTDHDFGGQVIYRAEGRLNMFIDSRAATAYGESVMREYLDFVDLKPGWESRMRARGVDAIMVADNSPFALAYARGAYHEGWQQVFLGSMANIYLSRP